LQNNQTKYENIKIFTVLLGMFFSYLLFFIHPVFLNPENRMLFFEYVPAWDHIGVDLGYLQTYITSWLSAEGTPYVGLNLYPPFAMLFFYPVVLADAETAYTIITFVTIASCLVASFAIPMMLTGDRNGNLMVLLFCAAGLFSYGLHFEIERGQFNLIAFALVMCAVYVFHAVPSKRFLAFVLLTISIQLKVYPAVFILMFIEDWRDWKGNLKRIAVFGSLNFLLLFILGYPIFLDFLEAIRSQIVNPESTIINHSIRSFSEILFRKIGYGNLFLAYGMNGTMLKQLVSYSALVENVLLTLFCIFFALVIAKEIINSRKSFSPRFLLACTLAALLIPSVSLDYKLPLIVGPIALFIADKKVGDEKGVLIKNIIIVFFVTFFFSTTLFSYENKPIIFMNNLPVLFAILMTLAMDAWLCNTEFIIKQEKL
jgi:hypothetical protein